MRRYLAAHPELQAEVDELGFVADLLVLAPQEYEPSPELRRNLLDSIGDASDAPHNATHAPAGVSSVRVGSQPPRSRRSRRSRGPRSWPSSGSLWNATLHGENEDLRGTLETRESNELQGSGPTEDRRGEGVEVGDGRAVLVAENLPPTPEG